MRPNGACSINNKAPDANGSADSPRCGLRAIVPREAQVRDEMAMTGTYETVDADGHILEPHTLWDDYIDPAFRERRPQFVIDDNGKERITVEGKLLGNPRGIGSLGSIGHSVVHRQCGLHDLTYS